MQRRRLRQLKKEMWLVIIKGRNAKKDMETKGKNEWDWLVRGESKKKDIRKRRWGSRSSSMVMRG